MTSLKDMLLDYRRHIHARDMVTDRAVRITGEFADALDGEFTNFARGLEAIRRRVTELEQQKPAVTTEEDHRFRELLSHNSGKNKKLYDHMKVYTYDNLCAAYGVENGQLGTFVHKLKQKADRADRLDKLLCRKHGELDAARDAAEESGKVCKEFNIAPGNLMQAFRNLKVKCERLARDNDRLAVNLADIRRASGVQ